MYKTDRPLAAPVKQKSTTPRSYVIGLIVGVVLLIPSIMIAHVHQLSGVQAKLFYDVNNLPGGFGTAAIWIANILGEPYGVLLAVVIPLLFRRFKLAWRYFVTAGGAAVVAEILKKVIAEPRPALLLHGHLHERAMENGLDSYPSGHATMATAIALTTWFILPPRWRWLSPAWIIFVSVLRVYVGAHQFNDVLGGFLVGLIAVCIVRLLPARIAKPLRLDGEDTLLKKNELPLKRLSKASE